MAKRKVIACKRDDGGVTLIYPNYAARPTNMTLAEFEDLIIQHRLPKDVIEAKKIDVSDIPTDTTYRDAWTLDDSKIAVDLNKAKEIRKSRVRNERQPVFEELDVMFMKALEGNDVAKAAEISKIKQELRDTTKKIDAAKSVDDLNAVTVPDESEIVDGLL